MSIGRWREVDLYRKDKTGLIEIRYGKIDGRSL